ncbi:hypothetical protein DPMN_149196, partial [Dreissena polymorpha]
IVLRARSGYIGKCNGLKFDPVPGGHKTEHMTFTRGDYCGRVAVTNNNNNILIMKLHRYINHDSPMDPY